MVQLLWQLFSRIGTELPNPSAKSIEDGLYNKNNEKLFLHLDITMDYAYIFLWDKDLEVGNFDAPRSRLTFFLCYNTKT